MSGRGELHLSVLIENMRREGYEFAVSKAEVLYKTDERGRRLEPMERAFIDVPEDFSGSVIQKLSNFCFTYIKFNIFCLSILSNNHASIYFLTRTYKNRKGELLGMSSIGGGYTRLEFLIPSRGLETVCIVSFFYTQAYIRI